MTLDDPGSDGRPLIRLRATASITTLLFALLAATPASAQLKTTTSENLSLRDTVLQLLGPVAGAPTAEAIAFATAVEVATAPFGTSSGGFVFKLDPATGLQVRTATTFGPSFAERALTSGAGKVSVAANLSVATYDYLGDDFKLSQMQLSSTESSNPFAARTGNASLVLSSETVVMSGAIGATDNLDLAVSVPMVKVKLDGVAWVLTRSDIVTLRATGAGIASGLGDIAVVGNYRFKKFGEGQPDPGGLAVMLTTRLPTGNRENFRGLGVVRSLASVLFSAGKGKVRPHVNGGFEWWEKAIEVVGGLKPGIGSFPPPPTVKVRHQIQYAAGLEFEAAPKLTLLVDVLGRHIRGGGEVDMLTVVVPQPNDFDVDRVNAAAATTHGIRKITLVPGVKWNLKGAFLLSLNALVPLNDNSLQDKFTPVVGLDWTF